MTESKEKRAGRNLLPLWLLTAVFGLPVILAWVFYMNPGWLPSSPRVNGVLIRPPRALPDQILPIHDGSEIALRDLEGQWVMIAVYGEHCENPCRRTLYDLRQVRRALGRDRLRLNRILALDRMPSGPALEEILQTHPDLWIVENRRIDIDEAAPAAGSVTPIKRPPGSLLVIDPLGNLMMRYRPDTPPDLVLEDMEHLMTVTKNWNKGCAVCPAIN